MLLESSIDHDSARVERFGCRKLKRINTVITILILYLVGIILLALKTFNFHHSIVIR
jgi:hypothetical protein